jgi:hypothetical protein
MPGGNIGGPPNGGPCDGENDGICIGMFCGQWPGCCGRDGGGKPWPEGEKPWLTGD